MKMNFWLFFLLKVWMRKGEKKVTQTNKYKKKNGSHSCCHLSSVLEIKYNLFYYMVKVSIRIKTTETVYLDELMITKLLKWKALTLKLFYQKHVYSSTFRYDGNAWVINLLDIQAEFTFIKMKNIFRFKHNSLQQLKLRLANCYVTSIVMYIKYQWCRNLDSIQRNGKENLSFWNADLQKTRKNKMDWQADKRHRVSLTKREKTTPR